jgi:flagellar basal body P-ring protein FlgI
MDTQRPLRFHFARREFLGLGLVALAGCTSPLIRGQSPEVEDVTADRENSVALVGDYCGAWGLDLKKLQTIGLVTNLDDTGSDPPPGIARDMLIGEMQGRGVKNPEKILASPKVSLVEVIAVLPPAVQKGDAVDVMVKVPNRSTTTSLRDGWLMTSRLRLMANFDGKVYTGGESGLAEGSITVDSIFGGDSDPQSEVRGLILGGGKSLETRTLGLRILRDDVSIETTSVIGNAVNLRFHTFDRGTKKGVAEPKDAKFVKLLVPPRYKHNLGRYVAVVRSIPLREAAFQRARRLEALEQKLFEATTCAKASLQLEAIGKEAIPALKNGLKSRDLETRFHAAEALAYLDEPESAKTLGEAARESSAFRWSALSALSSMDHVQAYEALTDLLHVSSAETRYGAFRALRRRRSNDPLVAGEMLSQQFWLHLIPTTGEPMIHISWAERCEIVLFGQEIQMAPPQGIFAGKQIMLTSTGPEQIKISRFIPGREDRVAYAGPTVEQVIRGIVSLGGTYGDVIQALQEAKQAGLIAARMEVDAVPRTGIAYHRDDSDSRGAQDAAGLERLMSDSSAGVNPESIGSDAAGEAESESFVDPKYSGGTKKGVWSKMTSWFSKQ